MDPTSGAGRTAAAAGGEPAPGGLVRGLLGSCHPGPTAAVTVLTALLAAAAGLGWSRGTLVVAAVLAGQLSIGWSNDLVDAARDRSTGRTDKPVATGAVPVGLLRAAIGLSLAACVVLSLRSGLLAGTVHLLGVAMGWAHNLGAKGTVLSPLPYAVAFACLPAFVSLAGGGPPEPWILVCGAVLGVAAHLLNALPDLADDITTDVVGLPQRLGPVRVRVLAPLLLLAGTVVAVLRPGEPGGVPGWSWAVLVLAAVLCAVAASRSGRVPFAAAVGVAVLCVIQLVVRSA